MHLCDGANRTSLNVALQRRFTKCSIYSTNATHGSNATSTKRHDSELHTHTLHNKAAAGRRLSGARHRGARTRPASYVTRHVSTHGPESSPESEPRAERRREDTAQERAHPDRRDEDVSLALPGSSLRWLVRSVSTQHIVTTTGHRGLHPHNRLVRPHHAQPSQQSWRRSCAPAAHLPTAGLRPRVGRHVVLRTEDAALQRHAHTRCGDGPPGQLAAGGGRRAARRDDSGRWWQAPWATGGGAGGRTGGAGGGGAWRGRALTPPSEA